MSPYQLVIRPDGQISRTIPLPLKTITVRGAQRHAREYQGDAGVSGTISVMRRVGPDNWVKMCVAHVKNSEITKWENL